MEGQPSIAIGAYYVYPGKTLGRGSFADVFMASGPKVGLTGAFTRILVLQ